MARNNDKTRVYRMLEVMDIEGRPLAGLEICITGHLAHPRAKIEELVLQAGGRLGKTVTYHTSYLVSNEDWTASTVGKKSSKQIKAEKLRKPIINEEKLLAMMSGSVK